MDGLGLREAEGCLTVCGPGAVVHSVAQEGNARLGLHVLRDEQIVMGVDEFYANKILYIKIKKI